MMIGSILFTPNGEWILMGLLLTHLALAPCHFGGFAGVEEHYLPAH